VATFDHGLRPDFRGRCSVCGSNNDGLGHSADQLGKLMCQCLQSTTTAALEFLARQARYTFLADVARRVSATRIVVAHNAGESGGKQSYCILCAALV